MKLRISIVFIVLFVSAYCQGYCSTAVIRETDNIIRLTGWQYYTGNDTTAEVKSINTIRLSDKWARVSSPYNIPKNNRSGIIWLRTKLPFRRGADAAVYIGQISNSMQVFLEGELIYQCGSFCPEGDKYMRWNQGLIRLPFYKNGAELYFQIRTGKEVSRIVDKSLFGSSLEITRNMFNHNAVNYIFLTIIFPSAIISLIIFFTLQRTKMLFGLAIFLISTGVIVACNTAFFQLIFNSPSVFYHMNYISCNMAPVSFYYLMEQVVLDKYKIIINALWKVKLALLIIVFIILEITSLIFYDIAKYFMLFNSVCLVIGMTVLVLSIRKSSYSSKVFIIGMSGILLSLMLEFIFLFSEGFASGFREYLKVFHFGAVIFVATIIWLVMHNYREADRERENIRRKEIDAIRRENETRHHFAAKLLESQEIERNRIALELHDSVGQKLLLIKNKLLSRIKNSSDGITVHPLQVISDLAGETIQEIRNITYNLRPQYLDQLGLTAAIETVVEKVSETSVIKFQMNIDEIDKIFSNANEINFYRIVQESLNNIVKHSKATQAFVSIKKENGYIHMEIKDNGTGFTKNGSLNDGGLGITGMKERARILGAEFGIYSGKDGTKIKMDYQIKPAQENEK